MAKLIKYLLLSLLFIHCSPAWHLKQAERHFKKAEIKGANVRVDTVYNTVTVIVPETHLDTVFSVQNFRDTITLEKDKIITKIKFDTLTRRLYVNTICPPDTVKVKVPFTVTKEINAGWPWWWLLLAGLVGAALVSLKRYPPRT